MKQKIINLLFVIGILLSLFFSWYKVIPCEITNDTYIGTIVTALSIVITLVIGYQIINVIEIRKDLREQRAENEKERNHYAQLLNDVEQKSLILERRIKEQENEASEGLPLPQQRGVRLTYLSAGGLSPRPRSWCLYLFSGQ